MEGQVFVVNSSLCGAGGEGAAAGACATAPLTVSGVYAASGHLSFTEGLVAEADLCLLQLVGGANYFACGAKLYPPLKPAGIAASPFADGGSAALGGLRTPLRPAENVQVRLSVLPSPGRGPSPWPYLCPPIRIVADAPVALRLLSDWQDSVVVGADFVDPLLLAVLDQYHNTVEASEIGVTALSCAANGTSLPGAPPGCSAGLSSAGLENAAAFAVAGLVRLPPPPSLPAMVCVPWDPALRPPGPSPSPSPFSTRPVQPRLGTLSGFPSFPDLLCLCCPGASVPVSVCLCA